MECPVEIVPGMWLIKRFVSETQRSVFYDEIRVVTSLANPRHMTTSRGFKMGVETTSCGHVGWVSDRKGYRYSAVDPESGKPWPVMPSTFRTLAQAAASEVGWSNYEPDTCLINRYVPGRQMGAHQDKDEQDFLQPVVSVSFGIPARFFVVGPTRRGRSVPIDVCDGDVVVFGAEARQYYHGVRTLKEAVHPALGAVRWNLTFRRAL
jgi:alkylated DNA repair protein (DNA oxidative demethylase)